MRNKEFFAPFIQQFFVRHLPVERRLSNHTIQSYRDTFSVFFKYLSEQKNKLPTEVKIKDVDSIIIMMFLEHLEENRAVCVKTRNQRLAAIKSFYKFMILHKIELTNQIQQILCIPSKKQDKRYVEYLTKEEESALLASLRTDTPRDFRDYLIIRTMLSTGIRVSELTGLQSKNVISGGGYKTLQIYGKGRKTRQIPVDEKLFEQLDQWRTKFQEGECIFGGNRGKRLTNKGTQYILDKYTKAAATACPSIKAKRVSNHTLRHTTAMRLLESGVAIEVIALWLGHEKVETTQIYLNSSLEIKQRILDKNNIFDGETSTQLFKPDDEILAFLKSL